MSLERSEKDVPGKQSDAYQPIRLNQGVPVVCLERADKVIKQMKLAGVAEKNSIIKQRQEISTQDPLEQEKLLQRTETCKNILGFCCGCGLPKNLVDYCERDTYFKIE